MFLKRHLPATVTAACLLLTAAACNGEPETQNSTTPTSTPSSTPTTTKPTVAPPTMPPAAQSGLTVTSAEAFARFYLSALDHAEATGDVRLLRQWQDKKRCVNCRSVADTYEQTYRSGGSVTGQLGTRIVRTLEARLIDNDLAVVKLSTRSGPTTWRKTAQAKPTNLPGGAGEYEFALQAFNGRWLVSEVVVKE